MNAPAVRLDGETIAALADELASRMVEPVAARVAQLVGHQAPAQLVTAAQLAEHLGCSAEWARDHADELGVIRLGSHRNAPLRFDLEHVRQVLSAPTARVTNVHSQAGKSPASVRDPRAARPGARRASGRSGASGAQRSVRNAR